MCYTPVWTTPSTPSTPDGHMIQLYYYMEQLGWQGKPRPAELRRKTGDKWPDVLEPMSDTYVDQVFQGPLG